MTNSKRLPTPLRHKKNIIECCHNGDVAKIIGYNSKTGLQQFLVLPIDYKDEKANPYFRGYRVELNNGIYIRDPNKKDKLSRFYFDRCSAITKIINSKSRLDSDLLKVRSDYYKNKKINQDTFGWYMGTGTIIKKIDLIFGKIFEAHLKKNRKELLKNIDVIKLNKESINKSIHKKFNRKITIKYLDEKHLIELIIGHLYDVKIECTYNDKIRLQKGINDYIKNNLAYV
jgi:hypothetical protein